MFKTFGEVLDAANQLPELKSMPKDQFIAWLEDNEEIYRAFRSFSMEAIRKGRTRFSAYMIRERVRWYTNIEYGGDYKISNNVTPYLSRLLSKDMPILDRIFARKEVEQHEVNEFAMGQGTFW